MFNQNILNARRKFFKAAIHTKSRDHIDYFGYTQCWLLVDNVHILFMLETIDSIISIPAPPAYEICIFQLIRYYKVCGSYHKMLHIGWLLTREVLNKGFHVVEVITSKVLRSPPWLGKPVRNICVTNNHLYDPSFLLTFRSCPHSWLINGFVIRIIRRVRHVEQDLLTFL